MGCCCAQLCSVAFLLAIVAQEAPEQLALPRVSCSSRGIRAVFGPLVQRNIHVRDMSGGAIIPVRQISWSCGVRLGREKPQSLSFFSRYDSCYAQSEGGRLVVPLQLQLAGDVRWFRVNISCPLIKRHAERTPLVPKSLPGTCRIESLLRVDCGPQSLSSDACYKPGCCYDAHNFTCFYKLNACSLDGHFVFSVKSTDTEPPLDPSSLAVKDHPWCLPVVTNAEMAIFKIGVMDCGAKMQVRGDTLIYEVEVEELHSKSITQNSPSNLQVQCEYDESALKRVADLRSFYAVTNPPPVVALGNIKVQMRLAKDESFTSFHPEDQLPLLLHLREAAYVEISIAQPSPDPTLSLRVRDCFAYPASRHSVWTLLYDGCPNPLDNMRSSVPVDKRGETTSHSQVRRFDVKTFAFVDPQTGQPSVEKIYFYCWVEICSNDVDCAQRCTIIPSEGDRQRRDTVPESDQLQLVFLGPLVLGQNNSQQRDDACVKQKSMFQVTVYILCGVGAVLLLILIFAVWRSVRICQNAEGSDAQVHNVQPQ
ncbi:zona pellucida sperm-binding protein 4-like [Brachionichthys hirsutus]|uniref:zona pellucida sperm-binding protein 4-like n=1 Tax=Brachionichthys hirsutus TaxID=412623 RepID=UPI0036047EAB